MLQWTGLRSIWRAVLLVVGIASGCGGSTTSPSGMDASVPDMDAGLRERPANLPPPFATGTGETVITLDGDGCLGDGEGVEIATDENVVIEIEGDNCFRTKDGEAITGTVTLRIDDAGGIDAQGSPGFLQGVIRLRVDAPNVGDGFVSIDREPQIQVELDDGGLGGLWEAVTYPEGPHYAAGPSTTGEREELVVTVVPINRDPEAPEDFSFFGAGVVAIRYSPPPEAGEAAASKATTTGPSLIQVSTELLNAGLSPGFEQQYPHLCAWEVVLPTAEFVAAYTSPGTSPTPHGQPTFTRDYQGTVVLGPNPIFQVESVYHNRLFLNGVVCDDTVLQVGAEFREPDVSNGGSEGEQFLPGPYIGRIVMRVSGPDAYTPNNILQEVLTWFRAPLRPVVRRFSSPDLKRFDMIVDMYGHQESVRSLESKAPPVWRFDSFDDRRTNAVIDELFFDFHSGEQGWLGGSIGVDGWGDATHLNRNDGTFKLDGTDENDNTNPNGFISLRLTVPSDATKVDFDVSAHDRDGADAMYRVRVEDRNGASHVLRDWTRKTGVEGSLTFSSESVSISAFRGQTLTLFMEQDANAPGANEQIYYDNIWIH